MKCFVDSNVWFYLFSETDNIDKTAKAEVLIAQADQEIIISVQVINEVCCNLIRKAGFSESQIQEVITDYYEAFTVEELSKDIFLKASELRNKHNFSYWDSMIVVAALKSKATILYSEDMQDGFVVENQLTIKNPFVQL